MRKATGSIVIYKIWHLSVCHQKKLMKLENY